MNTLLVTSTEEGIGKTAITLALASAAASKDLDVAYMKPKGTRLRSATGKTRDEDPMLARELLDLDAEIHEMEPVVYSPTFVQEALRGRQDPAELHERIESEFASLSSNADIVLVEGGGSLDIGSVVDLTDIDVARLLDARVLLVTPYDDVMDVDRTLSAAEQIGSRLESVLFNRVQDAAMEELQRDVAPFLQGRGVAVAGELPRDRSLAGVSVADLAGSLGAETLTSGELRPETLVERFVVGAMGGDRALDQFRRTRQAVVIAGGDRPEIQAAALEASGVEAIVLTGGHRPSSAIVGRADAEDVPMLLVQSDTRTTINRVEKIIHAGRTRTANAVERMEELLSERTDLDELLGV